MEFNKEAERRLEEQIPEVEKIRSLGSVLDIELLSVDPIEGNGKLKHDVEYRLVTNNDFYKGLHKSLVRFGIVNKNDIKYNGIVDPGTDEEYNLVVLHSTNEKVRLKIRAYGNS